MPGPAAPGGKGGVWGAERGDVEGENISSGSVDYGALRYVAGRLLERAEVKSRGADAVIEFKPGARVWLRKRILEEAGLLGAGDDA